MSSDSSDEGEAVGYRKPPKRCQFKPGRSGNPNGRPRKQKPARQDDSLSAILERVAHETVFVGGEEKTLRELEIRSLQVKAMKADMAAAKQLWALREHVGMGPTPMRRGGLLVVPKFANFEDWVDAAAGQQAQFRASP